MQKGWMIMIFLLDLAGKDQIKGIVLNWEYICASVAWINEGNLVEKSVLSIGIDWNLITNHKKLLKIQQFFMDVMMQQKLLYFQS